MAGEIASAPAFATSVLREVEGLFARYPRKVHALLPVLHLVQRENEGWIPPGWDAYVARLCETTQNHVRGVITFYNMFHTRRVGRCHLMVCTCVPCGLGGGAELLERVSERLGIAPGQTSADGRFSLEESQCLAACDRAPLVLVGDTLHGPLSFDQLDALLDDLPQRHRGGSDRDG